MKLWNTMPRRERMRVSCFWSATTGSPMRLVVRRMLSPSTVTVPWLGISSKLMQRSRVLLPEPLAPIRDTTPPSWAVSETPLSTSNWPKRLWMDSTSTIFGRSAWMGAGSAARVEITSMAGRAFRVEAKWRMRAQASVNCSSPRV
ncbi:hypothetical protein D9M71_437120 [compost metagenome]